MPSAVANRRHLDGAQTQVAGRLEVMLMKHEAVLQSHDRSGRPDPDKEIQRNLKGLRKSS